MKISVGIFLLFGISCVNPFQNCENYDVCNTNTNTFHTQNKNCFCSHCENYQDCCEDMILSELPKLDTFMASECNIKVNQSFHAYSIAKCDKSIANEMNRFQVSQCENSNFTDDFDVFSYVPVYSIQTSFTYKNIYCAKCNIKSIDISQLRFFSIKDSRESIDMKEDEIKFTQNVLEEYLNSENLKNKIQNNFEIEFENPIESKNIRHCVKSVDSCPNNSTQIEKERCVKNPTAYRYTFFSTYKNKYCGFCNGESETSLQCLKPQPRSPFKPQQSLQILFDLSELFGQITFSLSVNINGKKTQIKADGSCQANFSNSNTSLDGLLCYNINALNLNLNININQVLCEQDASPSDYIKKYITIFGQSISIISLLILLIMYSSHKLLRNGPGKILICLSISLLLSQIFFLISIYVTKPYAFYLERNSSNQTFCHENQNEVENSFENIIETIVSAKSFDCYLMSILSHYFHLAFFSWSNIMAYDLFKTFTVFSSSKNSKTFILKNEVDSKTKFFKYSLIAWLFPLTVVSALFFLQFFLKQMAYGFKTCFISNQINTFIFFVLPVCFLLFLNTYFLVESIKSIRNVDKLSKRYLKKDEDPSSSLISNPTQTTAISNNNSSESAKKSKNTEFNKSQNEKSRLILFLKLFVLTGMTWIFGLISSFDKDSFIWYIYIFLNSLQGLFIFLAYAFTPQTKKNVTRSKFYKSLSTLLRKKRSSFDHQESLEIKNVVQPFDKRQSI